MIKYTVIVGLIVGILFCGCTRCVLEVDQEVRDGGVVNIYIHTNSDESDVKITINGKVLNREALKSAIPEKKEAVKAHRLFGTF